MLMPKRTKHRKQHRGRMKGLAKGARELHFGDYGLVALEPCWLTNRQMEAARVAIVRHLRRGGKTWFRVFPDKPYTKRPAETRMGSGKGSVEGWVAVVKRGRVIMELAGVPEDAALEALRRASHKLPIKTKIVIRASQKEVVLENGSNGTVDAAAPGMAEEVIHADASVATEAVMETEAVSETETTADAPAPEVSSEVSVETGDETTEEPVAEAVAEVAEEPAADAPAETGTEEEKSHEIDEA